MIFEEEFPELKTKGYKMLAKTNEVCMNGWVKRNGDTFIWQDKDLLYDCEDIKESCLSKQKVKEAIEKYEVSGAYPNIFKEIKKELGL